MNKLPKRVIDVPIWLRQNGETVSEEEISDDVIAIGFWHSIEARARVAAVNKCIKLEGWVPTLKPEEQTAELQEAFLEAYEQEEIKWQKLVKKDEYVYNRLLAEGADRACDVLMSLEKKIANVVLGVLIKVKEKGLLTYMDGEHQNLRDYIHQKLPEYDPEDKKPSVYYDMDFIIDYVVPIMQYNGISSALLVESANNVHKARVAVPYLRKVLAEQVEAAQEIKEAREQAEKEGATQEELALFDEAMKERVALDTRLKDILEALMLEMSLTRKHGGMTIKDFQDHIDELVTGKKKKTPDKQYGLVYNTPEGGTLMIACDSVANLNAIKNLVSKLVDWRLGTPEQIAEEATKRLLASYQPDDVRKKVLEMLNVTI